MSYSIKHEFRLANRSACSIAVGLWLSWFIEVTMERSLAVKAANLCAGRAEIASTALWLCSALTVRVIQPPVSVSQLARILNLQSVLVVPVLRRRLVSWTSFALLRSSYLPPFEHIYTPLFGVELSTLMVYPLSQAWPCRAASVNQVEGQ